MIKRRRKSGMTDYKSRLNILKSGIPRVIVRVTNRYIIAQYVESKEAQDAVLKNVNSKELLKYGWPKMGSIKSIPACYLAGFLLGKKVLFKYENAKGICSRINCRPLPPRLLARSRGRPALRPPCHPLPILV